MTAYTGVANSEPSFDKVTMNGPIVKPVGVFTALAGGGQTGATLLSTQIAKVGTVATAADSVMLPVSTPGHERIVINATANSANVFPQVGDTINALSANTAFAIAAGKTAHFYCPAAGQWFCNLSA